MVTITQSMRDALARGGALAAFNAPGFDAMIGIGRAAAAAGAPAIIQVSARLVDRLGPPTVYAWFETARRLSGGQVFLHLDHCHDDTLLRACVDAGWDMVMFDGSSLPLEDNIARARALVDYAHARGTAVEGEVGAVGGEEDGHEAELNIASPDEIRRLGTETGIDCIAVGFGNVHGDYATKANLRWDVYEGARALCDGLPLVLHGGSGLTDAEFARAIRAGSAKVNISTDLKKAYAATVADPDLARLIRRDPAALHARLTEAAFEVAHRYITLFNPTS